MERTHRALLTSCLLLGLMGLSAGATAAPGDWKIGLSPGFSDELDGETKSGLGLQAYAQYGLGEYVDLVFTGGWTEHALGNGQAHRITQAQLGFSFNLDVLVVVPFAQLRLGWLSRWNHEEADDHGVGASLALGADWLATEHFHLGLAFELSSMLSHMDQHPVCLGVNLRLGWTFLD